MHAGYLPASGGLEALQTRVSRGDSRSPLVNEATTAAEVPTEPWSQANGAVSRRAPAQIPKVGRNVWGLSVTLMPHADSTR